MSSQTNIQDELRSLESSLPFTNNQPFSVPEGYFEGLASSVLAKIKAGEDSVSDELQELSPLLAGLSKKMPYSVPLFYFEENTAVASGIIAENESTILASIGKELPYKVSQGYFENLPAEILSRIVRPQAKVIPLFARKWMKMAAAAVVGGALFIAGYQFFNNQPENGSIDPSQPLVANNTPAIEQEIQKVSTEDLEKFVQNVQMVTVKENQSATIVTGKDKTKELLKDVTEAEMESFLSAMPAVYDELIVTD